MKFEIEGKSESVTPPIKASLFINEAAHLEIRLKGIRVAYIDDIKGYLRRYHLINDQAEILRKVGISVNTDNFITTWFY